MEPDTLLAKITAFMEIVGLGRLKTAIKKAPPNPMPMPINPPKTKSRTAWLLTVFLIVRLLQNDVKLLSGLRLNDRIRKD